MVSATLRASRPFGVRAARCFRFDIGEFRAGKEVAAVVVRHVEFTKNQIVNS
jgi:hypothetical protein